MARSVQLLIDATEKVRRGVSRSGLRALRHFQSGQSATPTQSLLLTICHLAAPAAGEFAGYSSSSVACGGTY
ncbi:MAG TPA: hypothetical protein DDW52_27760 [Planctomycetaceae bacterium]|nr:hypothetical protein [Planctomycetaceae bacterium]